MPNEQATPAQSTSPSSAYSSWLGRLVSLRFSAGELRTTLRCIVISESEAAVRVRVGGTWEVDIYKEMVLSVEDIVIDPVAVPARPRERTCPCGTLTKIPRFSS